MYADVSYEHRLLELLKGKSPLERARFLMQYAAAHGRKYERCYDAKGYKRRLRKPKEKLMDQTSLDNLLTEDAAQCHAMRAAGGVKAETMTTATAKAIAAGIDLKTILAAALSGYLTGGLAGAIAAVLALVIPKP